MRKKIEKSQQQIVEFAKLDENHKAEFIQFLIKNNINFQEGKQNCLAKLTIKNSTSPLIKTKISEQPLKERKFCHSNLTGFRPEKKADILIKDMGVNLIKEPHTPPRGEDKKLFSSAMTLKNNRSNTVKKCKPQKTPRNQTFRAIHEPEQNLSLSEKKNHPKARLLSNISPTQQKTRSRQRIREQSREELINKYSDFFEIEGNLQKRPIRLALSQLQKIIEEVYDEIFLKNTQCLQSKNYGSALKHLNQNSFSQLVEGHFRKKYKANKLIISNLSSMLYSLSFYLERQSSQWSIGQGHFFLQTFQKMIFEKYQYEDLVFYLFVRSMVKKEISRNKLEKTLSQQVLGQKDVNKILRAIVGSDQELYEDYCIIIRSTLEKIRSVNEKVAVYHFLQILLDDFHLKRSFPDNKCFQNYDSFNNTIITKAQHAHSRLSQEEDHLSIERKNTEELTFGEESMEQREIDLQERVFWQCQSYQDLDDELFLMISEKLQKKVIQLVELLLQDHQQRQELNASHLKEQLFLKSESLVRSIFEMNKIKWFKELRVIDPSEGDMEVVERMQMKVRQLRQSPSVREIGDFCKEILTLRELVRELELLLE